MTNFKKESTDLIRSREDNISSVLLSTGAVKLNVKQPFTFVSGIKSPIYCDNRLMIGDVEGRKIVVQEFINFLKDKDFDVIAGTSTAGIPWSSFIAFELNKPLSYIRGEKKAHGAGKQIEGASLSGKKVIIIEDLVSTGGSSIKAVEAAREDGAKEVELVSIFSYDFKKAFDNFTSKDIIWSSLSNFNSLLNLAKNSNFLTEEEVNIAADWNKNPDSWGK